MKAVMISIRPKWCEMIASGKKAIEVRKTKPKLDVPFKVYIYCTKGPLYLNRHNGIFYLESKDILGGRGFGVYKRLNGLVIGEFICDRVYQYASDLFRSAPVNGTDISTEDMVRLSRLSAQELYEYEYSAEPKENCVYLVGVYGWYISNLVIYDQPRQLKEFRMPCREYDKNYPQCGDCDYYRTMGEYPAECDVDGRKPMTRPPQSWCYVEEVRR